MGRIIRNQRSANHQSVHVAKTWMSAAETIFLPMVRAANCCVEPEYYCVGLDINTNHIRSATDGLVTAVAKPFHLGKTTQVWGIEIRNEKNQLIYVNRLTMAVLLRKS